RHLERQRAERSANDPPPLTPQRLRTLLLAIAGGDGDEWHWAERELDDHSPDDGADEALLAEVFSGDHLAALERSA
ncbi:MAG: hypothetical protein ABI249_08030, partial [Ornithinibacter sp.]